MKDRIKKLINPQADLNFAFQITKLFSIASFILNICLIICLMVVATSKEKIIGIDNQGIPYPVEVINEKLSDIISYRQFLSFFITTLYSWHPDTYEQQMTDILPFMSNDLRAEYRKFISQSNLINKVKENNVASVIKINNIKTDTLETYSDGYFIKIDAVKVNFNNLKEEVPEPVEFSIAFRKVAPSERNIWGFEIFELLERKL